MKAVPNLERLKFDITKKKWKLVQISTFSQNAVLIMRMKAFCVPSVRNLEKTIHEFWLFEEMRLFNVYANKGKIYPEDLSEFSPFNKGGSNQPVLN